MKYLDGITVLDFTQLLPGPYCTMLLRDLGAEVIKVEKPGAGDPSRDLMPGLFWAVNRGKQSLTLNLKSAEAAEVSEGLVKKSDVLVEGFRPGAMDKLGLGYAAVRALNPGIIYCSISGFGQTGPYRSLPGHDVNYQAIVGTLELPGDIEFPPVRSGLPVADLAGSMFATVTILAALHRRAQSGEGDYLDVSITDALFSWASSRLGELFQGSAVPKSAHDFEHLTPTNKHFETADGKKIALGLVEEKFWREFCQVAGVPEWLEDDRFNNPKSRKENKDIVLTSLRSLLKKRTLGEWENILKNTDVPWMRVNNLDSVFEDPHIRARDLAPVIDNENSQESRQARYPVSVMSDAIRDPAAPPMLGEHTEAILASVGYTRKRIETLREQQMI